MSSATMWCPSCGDEYVAGSRFCSDCRVALVAEPPGAPGAGSDAVLAGGRPGPAGEQGGPDGLPRGYVELGAWPRLAAVMLLRRLEDAGVDTAVLWEDAHGDRRAVIGVAEPQADFADAVVQELPVEDELPLGTLEGYVERIEARLAEIAVLLDELRDLEELAGPRREPPPEP